MRVGWVAIAAAAVAFSAYTFFGSVITSSAEEALQTVVIRDSFEAGTHELFGFMNLPSDCYDLSVNTQEVSDHLFTLVFETWKQPYRDCEQVLTPRAFTVVVFGPEQAAFTGTLDGAPLALEIVRE